jgi:aspartyl-tRNA(Asn)/glutamyl-tRNA(Gln) amidotransferase subunit C
MSINKDQIEHLANLARLGINEEEKEKFAEQLSSILDYFEQLKELNTDNVEPMSHVFDLHDITREDKVIDCKVKSKVLAEAPELEKKQVKVKAVFDQGQEH